MSARPLAWIAWTSLASWLAIACAGSGPITDNRLYDDTSADFRTALVLPLNVMAAMPTDLRAGSENVEAALQAYLREHGRNVETMSYSEARRAWRAAVDDCRSQGLPCDDFEVPARLLAMRLRESRVYDLVILPYLRFKLAQNCTEHVHWDGVERPVQQAGHGLYPEGPIVLRHVEMRAVSLEIYALTRDGAKAFEGDGGLEVVDRLRVENDEDLVVAYPRDDLFENPEWLREGVAVALKPLLPFTFTPVQRSD